MYRFAVIASCSGIFSSDDCLLLHSVFSNPIWISTRESHFGATQGRFEGSLTEKRTPYGRTLFSPEERRHIATFWRLNELCSYHDGFAVVLRKTVFFWFVRGEIPFISMGLFSQFFANNSAIFSRNSYKSHSTPIGTEPHVLIYNLWGL